MKKLVLLGFAALFTSLVLHAQSPLEVGGKQLNAGVGFSGWGIPLYVGLDYGLVEDITLGGELSFRSYHNNFAGIKYSHTIFGISANGNYHFNTLLDIPSEWDFYAGLNIGYFIWISTANYLGSGDSGFGIGAQIGGRYFFKDNFAVNLEFAGGNSLSGGKMGISYIF